MKKVILIYLIVFFILSPAFAQDPQPIDVQGVIIKDRKCLVPEDESDATHVAFGQKEALNLLQLRIDFPKLELKIDELEKLVFIKDKEVMKLEDMNGNLSQQMIVISGQNDYLKEEIEGAYKWYRSPYLWTSVGIVLGFLATWAITEAVKSE
jgi:hypothetical protein